MTGTIIGPLPPAVHKDRHYFETRDMIVDCRGRLSIHASAHFGRGVKIITEAHSTRGKRDWKILVNQVGVVIEKNVFINAYAILYNTKIEEGSIICAGAVILGRNVAPYVMVAGNPAVVIARWKENDSPNKGYWAYERKYFGRLQ